MAKRVALKPDSGEVLTHEAGKTAQPIEPGKLDFDDFRHRLMGTIGDGAMVVWFGEGIEFHADQSALNLTVVVPTNFFRERILSRFVPALSKSIEATSGKTGWRITVSLPDEFRKAGSVQLGQHQPEQVESNLPETDNTSSGFALNSTQTKPKSRSPKSAVKEPQTQWPTENRAAQTGQVPGLFGAAPIKATRRLDNFVVGVCNRLAQTAALEMIKSRGAAFNPLVLHGGVGLGKTHLLDGIAHAVRTSPGTSGRIIHVTAEEFTNLFLEAIRTGQLASFRNRFRNAAALVMDDVHFMAAKRATQNEFLHTFDALMADDVPIILSSDQHPKRINRLTEELATRFMAGMVVRLDTPDPEVRRLILRNKAAARGVALPENVIDLLGEQLRVSVRELEGALNSLIAHSVLTGRRIDLDLARMVLRDSIRHTVQSIGLREIESAVCQVFSISSEQLHGRNGSHNFSMLRTLAMYLSRRHTSASYSEIARHYGLKNHSSVIAAEKRVRQNLEQGGSSRSVAGFENMSDMVASVQMALGV